MENGQSTKREKLPASKTDPEKAKKQQTVLIILLILVAVGAVMILYRNGVFGGSAAQKPVEQYLGAIAAKDFDSYISSMPTLIAQEHLTDRDDLGLSGEEYMAELYGDYFDEFGDDMTVSLEFTGRSRLEKVYLDEFLRSYLEIYGEPISVKSYFEIDVTAHFAGSLSEDYVDLCCYVIKSGGKWYIAGCEYASDIPAPEAEE